MRSKLLFPLLFFMSAALLQAGCSTQQRIHNVQGSAIPGGRALSMQAVNKAITEAARFKRWRVSNVDDDTVEARITVRGRHKATVHIDYSTTSYDITLVNSTGLDQKRGRIHRNYNKWVILLDQEIQDRLLDIAYP